MNMQQLTTEEQERAAYMAGDARAAELLAHIAQLEAERDALHYEIEDLKDSQPDPRQVQQDAQDLDHLKQFFHDCFARLAGDYPCPEFSSDYDKNIIFEAIEKGEELDANGGAE